MCQWKLTRAEVDVPETTGNHTFPPNSDDEGEGDVVASGSSSSAHAPPSKVTPNMLDDSDESEDEAPAEEPNQNRNQ